MPEDWCYIDDSDHLEPFEMGFFVICLVGYPECSLDFEQRGCFLLHFEKGLSQNENSEEDLRLVNRMYKSYGLVQEE